MTQPYTLDLSSMYLTQPVAKAHKITLRLRPGQEALEGQLSLDPNHCGLSMWGDTNGCTEMLGPTLKVRAVRTRTADPQKHDRRHYDLLLVEQQQQRWGHLIEYPKTGMWYLVHGPRNEAESVVPLFPTIWFTAGSGAPSGPLANLRLAAVEASKMQLTGGFGIDTSITIRYEADPGAPSGQFLITTQAHPLPPEPERPMTASERQELEGTVQRHLAQGQGSVPRVLLEAFLYLLQQTQ
jgi:hypothetical protein